MHSLFGCCATLAAPQRSADTFDAVGPVRSHRAPGFAPRIHFFLDLAGLVRVENRDPVQAQNLRTPGDSRDPTSTATVKAFE